MLYRPQVLDESTTFGFARFRVRRTQDARRVNGGDHVRRQTGVLDGFAPLLRNPKCRSEQRLTRGRAKHHDHPRLDLFELCLQPGPTSSDLARVRLAVNTALAAGLPFE